MTFGFELVPNHHLPLASRGTDRSIIDGSHSHHGLEASILDLVDGVAILQFLQEMVIEPLGILGSCAEAKIRLVLDNLGEKRELRHCEDYEISRKGLPQELRTAAYIPQRISPSMSGTVFFH